MRESFNLGTNIEESQKVNCLKHTAVITIVTTKNTKTSIGVVIVCDFWLMKFRKPIRMAISEKVSPLITITR